MSNVALVNTFFNQDHYCVGPNQIESKYKYFVPNDRSDQKSYTLVSIIKVKSQSVP